MRKINVVFKKEVIKQIKALIFVTKKNEKNNN